MPVVDLERPNLGLSLLQALLQREDIDSRIVYGNLQFAERIGVPRYLRLATGTRGWYTLFLGEAVFSPAAFPELAMSAETVVDFALTGLELTDDERQRQYGYLREAQRLATEFIDDLAREVVAARPRIVGCTSTFQQHIPSLALLRRVRQLEPSIVTMLGGGNCETCMGVVTHKCFPWVDYVVSGEADGLIGPFVRDVLGQQIRELPAGVLAPCHRPDGYPQNPRAVYNDLESLPYPDFSDYFAQLQDCRVGAAIRCGLPVETSRGCWWGAKHHCTFCGLNGGGMAFRRKSPQRALDELEWLAERWQTTEIEVVDNILDMRYLDTVVPALKASPKSWNIFYEVKSNLKPAQLRALAEAGVRSLQPGIESLDSRVLALMDKGAKGWQQVQFLKYSREYGIGVSWNLLLDFPGEEDAWYLEMAEWAPLLAHLQPPSGVIGIRFDRYSPYFERRAEYGLALRPHPMLGMIYPLEGQDLHDLCYHFERAQGNDKLKERPGVQALQAVVEEWKAAFGTAELSMRETEEGLIITDTRPCAVRPTTVLTGRKRELYMACREAVPLEEEEALAELRRDRLLLTLDGRHLTLAVGEGAPQQPYIPIFPGGDVNIARLTTAELVPRGGAFERMFWHGESIG